MNSFTSLEILKILKDRKEQFISLLETMEIIGDAEQIVIIKGRLKELSDLIWILEVKCE